MMSGAKAPSWQIRHNIHVCRFITPAVKYHSFILHKNLAIFNRRSNTCSTIMCLVGAEPPFHPDIIIYSK